MVNETAGTTEQITLAGLLEDLLWDRPVVNCIGEKIAAGERIRWQKDVEKIHNKTWDDHTRTADNVVGEKPKRAVKHGTKDDG